MPTIKRYPNRKLYNTETKQYITIDKLADLIRAGEDIQVVDNATGEDLTALTMTQILFEQVKKQTGFLPRTLLEALIQAGGSRLSAVQKAVSSSLGFGHTVDDEIRGRIDQLVENGEMSEEEGEDLTQKLIDETVPVKKTQPIDAQVVEQVLSERGVATRRELQQLLDQIESVAEKLDDFNP